MTASLVVSVQKKNLSIIPPIASVHMVLKVIYNWTFPFKSGARHSGYSGNSKQKFHYMSIYENHCLLLRSKTME